MVLEIAKNLFNKKEINKILINIKEIEKKIISKIKDTFYKTEDNKINTLHNIQKFFQEILLFKYQKKIS